MTDEPEFDQQKLVKTSPKNNNPTGKGGFKPGFDKRRWVKGRGVKSPAQKEGEEIVLAVYWKELSRLFDPATGKPIEPEDEPLTALELAARKEIKTKFNNVVERIAGKVVDRKDITSGGEALQPPQIIEVIKTYEKTNDEPDKL